MAWQEPKTDWVTNPKNPKSEDFNRIEGNIEFLKQDIETKKILIADSINSMGQVATVNDTHAILASKIKDISKDADAAVSDVLSTKTFYQGGAKKTGAMPNRGAINQTVTTQNGSSIVQEGYHNGYGKVIANITNLISSNIKNGVNVGGIVGSMPPFEVYVGTALSGTIPFNAKKIIFSCKWTQNDSTTGFLGHTIDLERIHPNSSYLQYRYLHSWGLYVDDRLETVTIYVNYNNSTRAYTASVQSGSGAPPSIYGSYSDFKVQAIKW